MKIYGERLENGMKKNWEEVFQLMDAIGIAVDAIDEVETLKRDGNISMLFEKIWDRDKKIRNSIDVIIKYNSKYRILTRKINKGSYGDCVKAIEAMAIACCEALKKRAC